MLRFSRRNVLFSCALGFHMLSSYGLQAQEGKIWSLQDAIQYALEHNITIKQSELNERLARLTLQQSQYAQLPSANITPSYGYSHGRSINPTTNQFDDQGYTYLNASASTDVLVFGWFKQRHTIHQNKYSWEAAQADLDQQKNDVALNVATGYLRVILAKEQVKINEKQAALSSAQLSQTRRFAEAGRVPELNVAQLEAQLATDSSSLVSAIADYNSSVLDIKALLNLDFQVPFEVAVPQIPVEDRISLHDIEAEHIYNTAARNFASVKSSELKLQSARQGLSAAKGSLYPQFGLSGQLGSSYASSQQHIQGYQDYGFAASPYYVLDNNGNKSYLYQPNLVPVLANTDLGTQMNNNFRQTVSAYLNIPLFNSWQTRYSVKQAKINVFSQELNKYQTELKLRQDVYKAVNDVNNAVQKYYAAKRSQEASKRAFDFASKRYELGLTNTVDYLITQNNLYQAEGNLIRARYDLIFKLKVIDYYLGKELKL